MKINIDNTDEALDVIEALKQFITRQRETYCNVYMDLQTGATIKIGEYETSKEAFKDFRTHLHEGIRYVRPEII